MLLYTKCLSGSVRYGIRCASQPCTVATERQWVDLLRVCGIAQVALRAPLDRKGRCIHPNDVFTKGPRGLTVQDGPCE
jgi:hypothetical protein